MGILAKHFCYSLFATRLPVILLGVLTYFNINDNKRLSVIYTIAFAFALMTRDNMMITSCAMPMFLYVLSAYKSRFIFQDFFSFLGTYSLELYLAQSVGLVKFFTRCFIVNQYVMYVLSAFLIAVVVFILHFTHEIFWKLFSSK